MRIAPISLAFSCAALRGTVRAIGCVLLYAAALPIGSLVISAPLAAQAAVVETPVPFDAAGRITSLTPTLISRLGLSAPAWPVSGGFRDARLFRTDAGAHVLVVQRADGSVARFALNAESLQLLQQAVGSGLVARGTADERFTDGSTGLVVSQPAGNAFVRNQTFLGLVAYGPATAALLSNSGGAAATGGYFLAAGTSFFIAARTVQNRTVTRAQASRSAHGGTRGALAGAAIARIANANDGPGWGGPILAGALGGTVAGYLHGRGLSDGEAASAGYLADLGALTTLGVAGVGGVFKGREVEEPAIPGISGPTTYTDNSLRGPGKAAIAAAIGSGVLGYAIGPRYARRAAYNVTAGDINVAFAGAALGAIAATAIPGDNASETAFFGVATAGLLTGAVLADRFLVRTHDRTSADGTLAQLGAVAGALMGGGLAAIIEPERQAALALVTAGGTLGLIATDRILAPARDAGPLRGIMQSGSRALDGRVFVSLGPVSSVRVTF